MLTLSTARGRAAYGPGHHGASVFDDIIVDGCEANLIWYEVPEVLHWISAAHTKKHPRVDDALFALFCIVKRKLGVQKSKWWE
jgi:hypothetical protein